MKLPAIWGEGIEAARHNVRYLEHVPMGASHPFATTLRLSCHPQ